MEERLKGILMDFRELNRITRFVTRKKLSYFKESNSQHCCEKKYKYLNLSKVNKILSIY